MITKVKTAAEIANMRVSGQILATILALLRSKVVPGMSTQDLADIAANELTRHGATGPTLGYQGYPSVLCVSLNDEVVHGIPSPERIIAEGDIVSLDFCVQYKGMITDAATSVIAGQPRTPRDKDLLRYTEASLYEGIDVLHDNVRVGDIAAAVQKVLEKHHYGIVRDMVGHGVGHEIHEDPNIPNYGRKGTGPFLQAGMTIAIEPMATLGTERVYIADDGWTVLTNDGSWAAHFEHTVLITDDGFEILTQL
jgi:methionyl aminopeptidase